MAAIATLPEHDVPDRTAIAANGCSSDPTPERLRLRAATRQPGIRTGARRGGHPTARHDQRRAGRPDGVRAPRVRQPRPRRLDAGPRGRQGGSGPRAAHLLVGAPGQRVRQPASRARGTSTPATRWPASSGRGRMTRWSSPATPPTRGGCSRGCCPPTRPSWCSRPSITPRCCPGRPSAPSSLPVPRDRDDAIRRLDAALADGHDRAPARRRGRRVQRHRRGLAARAGRRGSPPAPGSGGAGCRPVRTAPAHRPGGVRDRLRRLLGTQALRPVRRRCAGRPGRLAGCRPSRTWWAVGRPRA